MHLRVPKIELGSSGGVSTRNLVPVLVLKALMRIEARLAKRMDTIGLFLTVVLRKVA